MTRNVGSLDRYARAALGAVLLYLAFFSGLPAMDGLVLKTIVAAIGIVMLVVSATRFCPIYRILGLSTARG